MRSRVTRGRWAGVALVAAALTGCGFTAPRGDEGFAELDSPGVFDVDRTFAISLGPTVLDFAARHVEDDPETRALLEGLEGVRVRIYAIHGDAERVADRVSRMGQRLRTQNWQPVAVVQESDGERVLMLMKVSDQRVSGLLVVASDASELVVVNLMGDLRPEMFGNAMAALNIDGAPAVRIAAADDTAPPG